jgi:hypothetical protein
MPPAPAVPSAEAFRPEARPKAASAVAPGAATTRSVWARIQGWLGSERDRSPGWPGEATSVVASSSPDADRLRRQVGTAAAAGGTLLALMGVVMALRGVPIDESLPAAVNASLLLARTAAGITMVSVGWALIRLSERLLLPRG